MTPSHQSPSWLAYASLLSVYGPRDINLVHECFGGTGDQARAITELFRPEVHHSVGELDPAVVAYLAHTLPDDVHVEVWDAYHSPPPREMDLYALHWPDFTAWRTRTGHPHRALLDAVMTHEPKAVVLRDSAGADLAVHRQPYEALLGLGVARTYPSYLTALLARLEALYGYTLCRGYWTPASAVLALVPSELKESVSGQLHQFSRSLAVSPSSL